MSLFFATRFEERFGGEKKKENFDTNAKVTLKMVKDTMNKVVRRDKALIFSPGSNRRRDRILENK